MNFKKISPSKKIFFSIILIFFLWTQNGFSAPINLSHKSWTYNSPFNLKINFSEPILKVMRTKNPDWSPDEMFVYEKPIPIRYSQEIWYFWLLDWYNATKFFINKYKLRIDPTRFIFWFKISEFSPHWNRIKIRNEWKNERLAIWRIISWLNFEEKLSDFRLKPWESKKIFLKNDIWDDMDRLKIFDPYWITQFRIQFTQNTWEWKIYKREFWDNIFRIKKIR